MNERWITFGGALLALIFATGLLFPRLRPPPAPVTRPTSQDAGEQGLLGLHNWLRQAGVPVKSLRTRYGNLDAQAAARTGNLLLIVEPAKYPVRRAEGEALAAWVERGNAVLVLRASAARPDWALRRGYDSVVERLGVGSYGGGKKRAEICRAAQPEKGDEAPPKPDEVPKEGRIRLLPSPSDRVYPLLAGVRFLEVKPSTEARRMGFPDELAYAEDQGRMSFVWLCDTARQRTAFWQFRHGAGTVWVSSYADLFANGNLGRADNARLLSNLVGLALGPGGAVLFDDMHQGDSALYDPEALFKDPRLHASLGLLLAIWLVYLLGHSNRFAAPAAAARGVTPAAFAEAVGGFYARSADAAETAQALLARFHADARRRLKRPGAGPAWELLERAPGVDPARLREARVEQARLESLRAAGSRYPRDLRRLAALIHQLRESLR